MPGASGGVVPETGSIASPTELGTRASEPAGIGFAGYETSHRSRTSSLRTASLSFPLGSLISQITEFGSTISNLQSTVAVGRTERSRSATSALSNARLTLRVTREIQEEPLASGGGEERVARRPDASFSRALLRHLGPGRSSDSQGRDSSGASAADEDEEEQEGEVEDEETTAAAAERHRLSSGMPGIDLQALTSWIEKSIPFLMLLFLVFLYNHFIGIGFFTILMVLLHFANETVRKQVAVKEDRRNAASRTHLLQLASFTIIHCSLWLWLTSDLHLYRSLIPLDVKDRIPSIWDCIFRVTSVDLLIRFMGLLVKIGVLLAHPAFPEESFRRRGQVLTAIEHGLLFYRAVLPVPVWSRYFMDAHLWQVLLYVITGLYLMLKMIMVGERAHSVWSAVKVVIQREAVFGKYVSQEELMEGGNSCAICQEAMTTPIKLHCNHVFCNGCITEWLKREATCPMCRAVVRPTNLKSYEDGATSLLPQMF